MKSRITVIIFLLMSQIFISATTDSPIMLPETENEIVIEKIALFDHPQGILPAKLKRNFPSNTETLYFHFKIPVNTPSVELQIIWYRKNKIIKQEEIITDPKKRIYNTSCDIPMKSKGLWVLKVRCGNMIIRELPFSLDQKPEVAYKSKYDVLLGFNSYRDMSMLPLGKIVPHRGTFQNNMLLSFHFDQAWNFRKHKEHRLEWFAAFSQLSLWDFDYVSSFNEGAWEHSDDWEYLGIIDSDPFGEHYAWRKEQITAFGGVDFKWALTNWFGMFFNGSMFVSEVLRNPHIHGGADMGFYLNAEDAFIFRFNGLVLAAALGQFLEFYVYWLLPFIYPLIYLDMEEFYGSIDFNAKKLNFRLLYKSSSDAAWVFEAGANYAITDHCTVGIAWSDKFDIGGVTSNLKVSSSYTF
ncbi:hypothetical protein KAU32_08600 [bacterium]|nr:hypothetical protein [bacterium]